ncbi:hemerythrin domain-containing protein [Thalassomonas viridans]|uniref:Hemerythrin domain-containing protein n=1 Tax=Thalassomonas viridans TaxID=137584 RepID=A0AAF0C851_9GAMM|nr:hemerythrin domain-containing protein [Thalassomonas viridans]WDE03509.1 hemerythrin domain-containing protein [Thalassomonas viridans]
MKLTAVTMNELMKGLQREHKGHKQLLTLLEGKLARLKQNIPLDFNLLNDAVNYIDNYAGRYHHPKEDIIYHYMVDNDLDPHKDFAKIIEEHNKLEQITSQVQTSLQSILLDAITSTSRFATELEEFIQIHQQHLHIEDTVVFPQIERGLTEEDWQKLLPQMPNQEDDPLFGTKVQAEYLELYHRLTKS